MSRGWKLYLKLTTGICRSKKRLDGKTVIVTGANTGIGKETARDLAQRGAKVILACRDLEKGKQACGATRVKQKITEDGLLLGMQVNHFGPFLLTCLLTDLLKRSSPSRIVIVASLVHRLGKLDLDDLNFEKSYGGDKVYCSSKLANILMSNELARKLKGTGVTVNSLHPGAVVTDLFRHFGPVVSTIIKFLLQLFHKDASEGAQTSIYLAVSEDVDSVSGKYFSDCKEARVSKLALDEGLAKKLWEKSEALVGLKPEEAVFVCSLPRYLRDCGVLQNESLPM
ncbi:hypothetical protein Cfor_10962 [Coptotermes formosanus]|uniref:Uncharacterized protein n=1 Tax=Coptotermes formosanus TaxID=36987 RepID=A0A6L2PXK4_COPFO|nr:hypothetical protein Cfor_10962 [Coptotermes formosanus]